MHAPTLHERATIYLLLADVLGRLSKLPDAPEAKKVGGGGRPLRDRGGGDSSGQGCMMEVCGKERWAWNLWDHLPPPLPPEPKTLDPEQHITLSPLL